jgi:hypothetical protein
VSQASLMKSGLAGDIPVRGRRALFPPAPWLINEVSAGVTLAAYGIPACPWRMHRWLSGVSQASERISLLGIGPRGCAPLQRLFGTCAAPKITSTFQPALIAQCACEAQYFS